MAKQTAKKTTRKPGPKGPSKYRADFHPFTVVYMARTGMIDVDMAEAFGVAESTIQKWKQDHPPFAKAITKGKEDPDAQVEASLFQRANGYTHEDKHYPPDVVACIFWLKNRRQDRWRDKHELLNTYDDSVKDLAKAIRDV
jgi:hypothetical protein